MNLTISTEKIINGTASRQNVPSAPDHHSIPSNVWLRDEGDRLGNLLATVFWM